MDNRVYGRPLGEHDWHSPEYVRQWIERDVTRDDQRRHVLQEMLNFAPIPRTAIINVLDVGAGYGVVSELVLKSFPEARLTLQDYSAQMFEQARQRLEAYRDRVSFVRCDLRYPDWAAEVRSPFDLIVSGLAIHNLRESRLMLACYGVLNRLLGPGGIFLDYDLFGLVEGGLETHRGWLREAGFQRIECIWEEPPLATIAAWP